MECVKFSHMIPIHYNFWSLEFGNWYQNFLELSRVHFTNLCNLFCRIFLPTRYWSGDVFFFLFSFFRVDIVVMFCSCTLFSSILFYIRRHHQFFQHYGRITIVWREIFIIIIVTTHIRIPNMEFHLRTLSMGELTHHW